jgi:4-diphosphocytidyl-2C-methyl-D-erythritol kinase
VPTIAEVLEISASIAYSHLVEIIGLKIFLTSLGSPTLTSELREKRLEFSNQLLQVLESQQRVGFHNIMTGTGSWFLQHCINRQKACISADEIPTRVTHSIAATKIMLTML